SALDYAVYALAIAHEGIDPPTWAHRLEFPITTTEKRWGEALGRHSLDGLPGKAIDYIASIQPWQAGQGADDSPLAAFEELVGINKHRFIATMWSKLRSLRIEFVTDGMRIEDFVGNQIPGE